MDISFENKDALEECKAKYSRYLDDEEFYFIAEDMLKILGNRYICKYTKLSYYAGVLTISNK